VQEHYRESIPDKVCLLELGWYTRKVIVTYVECERYGKKGYHIDKNRGQGVISNKQRWCGCQKRKEKEVVRPRKAKAQQSGAWLRELEGIAKKGGRQREVRRTFKMLREVWLNISVENIDMHEGVMVKALLDSGVCKGTSRVMLSKY